MRYRRKFDTVDAIQFTGSDENFRDCKNFLGDEGIYDSKCVNGRIIHMLSIQTPNGILDVPQGDFILRGTKGELYLCKPEIFDEIYEAVG